jgi:hypothetical protein
MDAESIELQLIAAELKLARALERLSALRRAALYGNYDAQMFDGAVIEYRKAEEAVIDMRRARTIAPLRASDAAPPAESPPADPTPRLLFARWLVRTGRLSDWDIDGAHDSAGVDTRADGELALVSQPAPDRVAAA